MDLSEVEQASPEIPTPDPLDDLLCAFDAPDADGDEDDGPDAVDSASMPVPACVPLFDLTDLPAPRARISGSIVMGALMVLAGLALAWLGCGA